MCWLIAVDFKEMMSIYLVSNQAKSSQCDCDGLLACYIVSLSRSRGQSVADEINLCAQNMFDHPQLRRVILSDEMTPSLCMCVCVRAFLCVCKSTAVLSRWWSC